MIWFRLFCLLAVAFSWIGAPTAAGAAAKPVIPLEDFYRNPAAAGYQLSPDGTQLAFLQSYENRLNVFVRTADGGDAHRITAATERDIRFYVWKNDSTILYLQDSGGDENYHLYAADVASGRTRDLTPFPGVKVSIVDLLPDEPNQVLIQMNQRNPALFDVYRLRLSDNSLDLEIENPGSYVAYQTDWNGVVRMALGRNQENGNNQLFYRSDETAPFRLIRETDYHQQLEPIAFTADNRELYAASNIGRDKSAIVRFDPDSAAETALLFQSPQVDVNSAYVSRLTKQLVSASFSTAKSERYFFDPEAAARFARLQAKLPNYSLSVTSLNRGEDRWIVVAYSDRNRGISYLYDVASDTLTKLGEAAPWLNETALAEQKPVQYVSRDGLTIHGYLTLPPDKEARNLPVVIYPHGGPWARDHWGFTPDAQFLASRGYAVLQMNFRGSTGYGKAFLDAGNKQWGRAMQDDISDGVAWLVKQRIADPKRVAIYGASYGGYATLAGLTFTPELYACGIDYVGPSNLFTLLKSIPPYWGPMISEFHERMGHPEKDAALLRSISPAFHADQIKAPLLVAQGARDPRVNKAESDQIVTALKARNIPVQYIVYENEGHGFSNEEHRFAFVAAMEQFLARYLQPER